MNTCFEFYFPNFCGFYLIAVLIFCMHFIIYRRVHNVFGTRFRVSFLVELMVGGFYLDGKRVLGVLNIQGVL